MDMLTRPELHQHKHQRSHTLLNHHVPSGSINRNDHERSSTRRRAIEQSVLAPGHPAWHSTRSGLDMLQIRAGCCPGRIPWCHEPGRLVVIRRPHRPKHPLPSPPRSARPAQGTRTTSGFTGRRSCAKATASRIHGARKHVVIGGCQDVHTC